jgi:hypothetical protein
MRVVPLTLFGLVVCSGALAGQDSGKPRAPKSGDTIVVTGCLRGSMLESTSLTLAGEDDPRPASHTFQLKGKKELLKELREKHDGYVVAVTGVLKSRLADGTERGTQVGNTRIVIGAESSIRAGQQPGTTPMPVLEAKSYDASQTTCPR